ncbi:cytochrome C oxidase subunit IV family protein [Lutibacter sp. A64]|uniref:cytochrome C oxidase subunit IV family protein n=1 Tax=Lutibacter sp. A64 TaxID=2918526 RepID=UPI001F05923F|nr:cytochrome C oxidase subunit IV family protein [Lutibacter sp. A64]UMB55393.1 cytochrome C oxidase subunit IV family protein [Lutibacter sp. A64]
MTNKIFLQVWVVLILLTITTALISNTALSIKSAALLILGIAVVKFYGVSFYFMEVRKAHLFWKIALLFCVLLFLIISLLIL